MSNIESSKLFEAVIEEVINDSRQDFENSGVDESTLQELKKIWQEKLTQSQVSKFSWDEEFGINNTNTYRPEIHDDLLLSNDYGSQLNNQLSYNNNLPPNNDIDLQLPNMNNDNTSDLNDDYEDNGGLMLPTVTQTDGSNFELTIESNQLPDKLINKLKKMQVDGELGSSSDGFNDSDDINSELDDDLDSDKNDEDDELDGDIMLCLYDKVQRIKNKWKCNLKEGVANIHGKDYVFQKASGESEW